MRPTRWLMAAILTFAGVAPATAQDGTVTVFVVRHAEKGPGTPDPSLTEAGNARALALTQSLRDQKITAIFSSEFKRTQETAAPLGQALGISTTVIGAAKTDELIAALTALPPGSKALVVSHSNLVGVIVEKLSGQKVGELTDADYDRLYIVTLPPNAPASVLYLHYGAPAPAGTGSMRPEHPAPDRDGVQGGANSRKVWLVPTAINPPAAEEPKARRNAGEVAETVCQEPPLNRSTTPSWPTA